MHTIQSYLLKRLTLAEKAKYSEIKPPKTPGNQFAYHLKNVLDAGLVKKDGAFYVLTTKGQMLADRMSIQSFKRRVQPKIVTATICQRKNGNKKEILFCRRDKQPFLGTLGLPFGKIHLGERVGVAARREMFEKTKILPKKITYHGEVYIIIWKENQIFSHILYHLFSTSQQISELDKIKLASNCFWKEEKEIKLNPKNFIPGTKELLSLYKKKGRFFEEISLNI